MDTRDRWRHSDVMKTDDEERFAERYSVSGTSADLQAELDALGSDYEANGYTTRAQADDLGRALALESGHVLLDLGSGCGWPGLYLAARHGCAVVSVDPVVEGCRTTRNRAWRDGLRDRSLTLRAGADSIPLRSGRVDAIVHGDLLC